jgi:hypothetical protein
MGAQLKLSMWHKTEVMRRIFESKRDEMKGDSRNLHDTELYTSHSSSNTASVIKSR